MFDSWLFGEHGVKHHLVSQMIEYTIQRVDNYFKSRNFEANDSLWSVHFWLEVCKDRPFFDREFKSVSTIKRKLSIKWFVFRLLVDRVNYLNHESYRDSLHTLRIFDDGNSCTRNPDAVEPHRSR